MKEWKCCVKEPSEAGKKVLCQRKGDFYVAMRVKDRYIPLPFADHYFCNDLSYPETWSEIDFPDKLHGYLLVKIEGDDVLKTLSEFEELNPEEFEEFANWILHDLGSLKRPEKKKE